MAKPVPNPLHRLFYRSRASAAAAAQMDRVVDDILSVSIYRNSTVGLSGLLLVVGDHFIQSIEGNLIEVRNTYARISMDRRHRDLSIISQAPAQQRLFGDWNMCASVISPSDKVIVDALGTKADFDPQALNATSVQRLLTTVAAIQSRASQTPTIAPVPCQTSHGSGRELDAFEID